MDICWIVLTDGRQDCLRSSLPSWIKHYGDKIENKIIIDDSADENYRGWLRFAFPHFKLVTTGMGRQGYSGAMQKVFDVFKESGNKYMLHLEDDYVLEHEFSIEDVITVLENNPDVAQMSIMRQPWFQNEIDHGGVLEALEVGGSKFQEVNTQGFDWARHKAFYTCNPNIAQSWVTNYKWPEGSWSESRFSKTIFQDGKECGIWGSRSSWPYVKHIGRVRNGTGY
jgi:hypothetical protein